MKKMLAFFSWVPGKVAEGRKGEYKTRIYPAWQLLTNPVFIPLDDRPQTRCLSRLAATHKPSVYPAWRPLTNPAFVTLAGRPQTQRLSRLAAVRELSIYPAWRLSASPRFIPLGGCPRAQHLPRLAAARKPGVCPAWRAPNPEPCTERIPSPACGGRGSHEKNARIFFMGTREGGRRPEGVIQNQDLSRLTVSTSTMTLRRKENVETLPATSQKTRNPWLSRLAAAREPSIYPAYS